MLLIYNVAAEHAWLPLLLPNLQPGYSNSQLTYGLNFATTAAGVLAGTFPGVVMRRLKLGSAQWCHGSWDKKINFPNYFFFLKDQIDICFFSKYWKCF